MCRSNILFVVSILFLSQSVSAQLVPFAFMKKKAVSTPLSAPSYVASSTTTTGDTSTSTTVTKPASVQAGDLMIVWQTKSTTAAVTAPAGWTQWSPTSVGGYGTNLFTKVADASDVAASDYTFTWTGSADVGDRHSVFLVYRGVNASVPVSQVSSNTGAGSTATYLSVNVSSVDSTVVAIASSYNFPGTPTGFTSRNAAGWATRASDRVITSLGATGNFTSTADTAWGTYLILLSP